MEQKDEERRARILKKFSDFQTKVKNFAPDLKLKMPVNADKADDVIAAQAILDIWPNSKLPFYHEKLLKLYFNVHKTFYIYVTPYKKDFLIFTLSYDKLDIIENANNNKAYLTIKQIDFFNKLFKSIDIDLSLALKDFSL